ncbi:MAG: glycosyltransferase [Lentisphaeria bacterium]|nr:glycosyltransferase [Lentisphaeria bacterium]
MNHKKVAVITRTKNREILLHRARMSVAKQTFKDLIWVIVNDGGERPGVDAIAEQARAEGIEVLVLHHEQSKGMEAASNAGIRACDSDYIIIHDDDDSWEAEFLERTVHFLETEPIFAGVITHTLLVNEVIEETGPRTTSSYGFNTWLKSVYLMELLMNNSFPPISFLYKRKIYEKVGGYNESLPVLGDWDFNIRFLQHGDIGVIPELLALYHHRDTITDVNDAYGNTVNAGIQKHVRYDAILRNHYLRTDPAGLGVLVNLAVMTNWQNSKIDKITVPQLSRGTKSLISYLKQKSWFGRLIKKLKEAETEK